MRSSVKQFTRLMSKRSRSGQAIILVAFAFIALIAFVGIATDVALLFVRYSTLRRAVDAAAIAAAGQVRESSNYLALNAVAQQFIKVHGLDPTKVVVETCETEAVDYIKQQVALGNPAPSMQQAIDARIAASPPSELCKKNPQKLVRVTAQIESRTAFLQLLGWRTVTLEANALSQTAVLDVALVLDTGYSEAADTIAAEKAYPCTDTAGNPDPTCAPGSSSSNKDALKDFHEFTNNSPYVDSGGGLHISDVPKPWGVALDPYGATSSVNKAGRPSNQVIPVRQECWYMPEPSAKDQNNTRANYGWAGCCNDPTTQSDDVDAGGNPVVSFNKSTGTGFNKNANWYVYDSDDPSDTNESVIMTSGWNPFSNSAAPFAPAAKVMSNQPDGNYSDLLCRPFKDVRDAARKFIKRLDFVRGDRVFLVSYDSGARAIVPYGEAIPAITEKGAAIRALNMQVGVDVNNLHLQKGCQSIPGQNSNFATSGNPEDTPYVGYGNVNRMTVLSYWTLAQCPDSNAGGGILAATSAIVNPDWIRRDAVWVMVVLSDGYPNRTPAIGNGGIGLGLTEHNWLQTKDSSDPESIPPNQAGTGAGVDDLIAKYCWAYLTSDGTASGTYPLKTVDGTPGGAPDPNGISVPNPNYGLRPQWCATQKNARPTDDPLSKTPPWGRWDNDKGSFGFCPWWTFCDLASDFVNYSSGPDQKYNTHRLYQVYPRLSQCLENNPRGVWDSSKYNDPWPLSLNEYNGSYPACSDNDPDSRHFCMDGYGRINATNQIDSTQPVGPTNNADPGNILNPPGYYCDPHYDPDDYARDRVDFAALINYMDRGADGKPKKGNFIAMYSIYFQHNNTSGQIKEAILGVKFLRYVADAGDNGIIDNHLQRWYRDMRDGRLGNAGTDGRDSWRRPPMGLNEGINGAIQTAEQVQLPPTNGGCNPAPCNPASNPGNTPNFQQGQTKKYTTDPLPGGGTQPVPPTYNGTDGVWTSLPYNYAAQEDPCAAYDFRETGDAAGSPNYEKIARTDCGQFFFADSPAKVSKAFVEIAGRLFTRLSR